MRSAKIILVLLFIVSSICVAQSKVVIKGKVTDGTNPIGFASVFIQNSTEGTMTGEEGEFSFTTKKKGKINLIVTMIGYEKYSASITIDKQTEIEYNIILKEAAIKLEGVVVTASAYGTEKEKGVVLNSMDVYTTPGGAADLFQSLKTLPGVTPVSESAQLYVRGGDPIETITMIDQATMYHPYTFESSYGGLFSSLNTATIKNIYFSSGGFSAKYGNALSGVLDVETLDNPINTSYQVGVSMANADVAANIAASDNFGIRLSARQTFTKPIFLINGGADRLTVTPTSSDLSTIISYKYSQNGKLKLSAFFTSDRQGVDVDLSGYTDEFTGKSTNKFIALQNVDILASNIVTKTSLSFNEYSNNWKLGILDLTQTDYNYKFRNDMEITLTKLMKLNTGVEVEHRVSEYLGVIPAEDYDMRSESRGKVIDSQLKGSRIGGYAEMEILNPFGLDKFTTSLGLRGDYIPELKISWFDPRMSIGYKLDEFTTLALGLGQFGQLPNPRLFAAVDGNPNLKPMYAQHVILSFSRKFGDNEEMRLETYYKNYKDLPLENDITNYDNSGYGYAKGIDFIFKTNNFYGFEGWVSYGIMDSKRFWMDYEEFSNSDYNITHNITIVAKYRLTDSWMVGINAKFATGRPYTPVVGSIYHEDTKVYEPVYGSDNSEKYQPYKRVDLRLLYIYRLFDKYSGIIYMEGLNILNFRNLFGYAYSADYTSKKEIESYFGRRMLVVGASINF
jgi:vitamin B12 transporter